MWLFGQRYRHGVEAVPVALFRLCSILLGVVCSSVMMVTVRSSVSCTVEWHGALDLADASPTLPPSGFRSEDSTIVQELLLSIR